MSKTLHYVFDAVLLSALLSGARRHGRLEFKTDKIENKTVRSIVENYLWVGDWIVDNTADQLVSRLPEWVSKSK